MALAVVPQQNAVYGEETTAMWKWALAFLIIALIASVLGFGGLTEGSSGAAHILFYLFLTLFVGSLVMGLVRRA